VQPSFRDAFRSKDFVVTVELPILPTATADSLARDAATVAGRVDGFLLTDNQYGQPHMSPAAAAGLLLRHGYAPILQLSCRNRNRIALIGELLGARATGLDSLVLVRGGVLPEGYTPRPKAVMDTDAKELIATAKLISDDERLGAPGELLIGTSATVHTPAPGAEPTELIAKADAGAQLIIAQICQDPEVVRRYMEFLVTHHVTRRLSVIVSMTVIASANAAAWLRANRGGTVIPDSLLERLDRADYSEDAAVEEAARLVRELREIPGISGINLAALPEAGLAGRVLDAAGLT
jgi:methylenetetrahydrofolate reductase (NADPH)